MNRTIRVEAGGGYDVVIGRGLLREAGERVRAVCRGGAVCLVSDDRVFPLYGETVTESLQAAGFRVETFVFPNGEVSKTPETWLRLTRFLAEKELDGTDAVVALGGGVVGDLAGFAAASYRRGVPLVQLPTTLLAAVDSSVGGKTAVDLPEGKNLLGAFWQPALVLCDGDTFATLPPEVRRDGCAEILKYGMLCAPELLETLLDPERAADGDVIERCVEIKRDIVQRDERDRGERKLLNFGHTVGHAVEKLSGFSVTHGCAVAVGMATVTRAAVSRGLCPAETAETLLSLLERYGLPTHTEFDAAALAQAMRADKKRAGDTVDLIVPRRAGHCEILPTPVSELEAFVAEGLE